MKMIKKYDLWNRITIKSMTYRKNFDLNFLEENFITEHEGTIGEIRIKERKPPIIAGEFGFSMWNLGLARQFDADLLGVLMEYKGQNTYDELYELVKDKKIKFTKVDKLVLLHTFILRPDYRGKGLTEEFVEFLYRDYYGERTKIIALVLPVQSNPIDWDYYLKRKTMKIRHSSAEDAPYELIPGHKYFGMRDLETDDMEMVEYKLFALASNCGFRRINNSHLFEFEPDAMYERIKIKREEFSSILK